MRILTIGLGLCVLTSLVLAQEKAGKSRRGALIFGSYT